MKIVFKYRQEKITEGQIIYRPIAKVTLIGLNDKKITEYMYIDSGADFTLIPYRLGLYIGLNRNQQNVKEIQGISGSIGVIYHDVTMCIGGMSFPIKIAWAQIENIPLLLGRTDVFDNFTITFDQKKRNIIFKARKFRKTKIGG